MDVLTDVMETVRVRSNCYGRAEFSAPWGIHVPHEAGHAGFFVISRGSCWLNLDGRDNPIPLAGGDFLFFPQGHGYTLRDALDSPVIDIDETEKRTDRGRVCVIDGGGALTSAVWGCFEFEDGGRNPLLDSLPPMIHLTAEVGPNVQWLQSTLQFVASETASSQPGAETVANRLTDILFVHAIRAYISGCAAHGCRPTGWLRALADPKIGQVLRLIHESPQKPWTVDALAEAVSMSRSAFAAQFTTLVGEPPLRYITAWRMNKATHLLLAGDPIAAIARMMGYDTDAAFGKAFKKHIGTTPGEFRRQARDRANAMASECAGTFPPEETPEVERKRVAASANHTPRPRSARVSP